MQPTPTADLAHAPQETPQSAPLLCSAPPPSPEVLVLQPRVGGAGGGGVKPVPPSNPHKLQSPEKLRTWRAPFGSQNLCSYGSAGRQVPGCAHLARAGG